MNPNEDTAMDRYAASVSDAYDTADRSRAEQVLAAYRPRLVAEAGEAITARIYEHRGLGGFVAEMDALGMDADEAVRAAAAYLTDHIDATVPSAFATVRASEE